jgi:hypothetical protein
MATPVNIFLTQDSTPIPGASVYAFDPENGYAFMASATTDDQGQAALLLPGSTSPGRLYELRLFKIGMAFANPKQLRVLEPVSAPDSNDFDVPGFLVGAFGIPANPRLCRCVGRLLNYSQQPVYDAVVRVMADVHLIKKAPKIVDGALISVDRMETRTDNAGFFVFDLIRTGEYFITFSGETDRLWNIKVPDQPSFNIVELIHPQPLNLAWGMVGNSLGLSVGSSIELPVSMRFSDDITRITDLYQWLEFTNSDPDIIDVVFGSNGALRIQAKAPGTASITPNLKPDLMPVRVPDYNLGDTLPMQVTVVP